jgi:hypothetical protein
MTALIREIILFAMAIVVCVGLTSSIPTTGSK